MDFDINAMRVDCETKGAPLSLISFALILVEDMIWSGNKHSCEVFIILLKYDTMEALNMTVF